MDEIWKCFARWKKPVIEGYIYIVWFHSNKLSPISKSKEKENRLVIFGRQGYKETGSYC